MKTINRPYVLALSLFALFLVSQNSFAQLNEEATTLETETGNIEGTLLSPDSKEAIPLALLISGSGPTDRNGNNPVMVNNSLWLLAEGLAENGIASLRFDKRGIAESQAAVEAEGDLRFEHYVEDVQAWIELLRKDKRFSKIYILGHSEGSLIGMIAAKNAEAEGFVSIAGTGFPAGDIIREQIKKSAPYLEESALPIIEKIETGETVEEVNPMLMSIFRPSVQPYMISWFKYNPQEEIAKLEIPVLIIQGTTDIQVSTKDAEQLAAANKGAEKEIFEGMNHVLKEAEADQQKNIATYSDPDLPLKEGLVKTIANFIRD